jgi:RNA polymerase sigma factor (TIGR02999 family)
MITDVSLEPQEYGDDVTRLLKAWRDGDTEALDLLWPAIYHEIRRIARGHLGNERQGHTLQATALVHEAFLRLLDQRGVDWQNRQQFFAITSRMMRRTLVDHARKRSSLKRGGDVKLLTIELADVGATNRAVTAIQVDEALSAFESIDPEKARIVELKFFGGLTNRETADVLGCSEKTVQRRWKVAKVWLYRELSNP